MPQHSLPDAKAVAEERGGLQTDAGTVAPAMQWLPRAGVRAHGEHVARRAGCGRGGTRATEVACREMLAGESEGSCATGQGGAAAGAGRDAMRRDESRAV